MKLRLYLIVCALHFGCGTEDSSDNFETSKLDSSFNRGLLTSTFEDRVGSFKGYPLDYHSVRQQEVPTGHKTADLFRDCEGGLCNVLCSEDYTRVDSCWNEYAPPSPTIRRNLKTPDRSHNHQPSDNAIDPFESLPDANAGEYYDITHGYQRSTNDGRIHSRGNSFFLFKPELLERENTVTNQGQVELPYIKARSLTRADLVVPGRSRMSTGPLPHFFHSTICDASGVGKPVDQSFHAPRSCRAKLHESDAYTVGDCYDISHLAIAEIGAGSVENRAEIRTIDYTVFVPKAKSADAGKWDTSNVISGLTSDNRILFYPRTRKSDLPPFIDGAYRIPHSHNIETFEELSELWETECTGEGEPGWCEFRTHHHYNQTDFLFDYSGTDADHEWNGLLTSHPDCEGDSCRGHYRLFEPSVTADGRLLVLNVGIDTFYSYNKLGPCRADGFTTFKPIMNIPFDPDLKDYPIYQTQQDQSGQSHAFRDTNNKPIDPKVSFNFAYPWIDREGRNIFFSASGKRKGHIRAIYESRSSAPAVDHDFPPMFKPDGEAGKYVSVLGAWTQGKIVYLDNNVNFTDFGGGRMYWAAPYWIDFELLLYRDRSEMVRPRGTRSMLSNENMLNHYDAVRPLIPYDVIWTLSSVNKHQAEIPFDDFMRNNLLMNLPMNASLEVYPQWNRFNAPIDEYVTMFPDDGFVPNEMSNDPTGRYIGNPHLQNVSSASKQFSDSAVALPTKISLRGGARVEPVGQGGVIGKGIYLDGLNDFIDVELENQIGNEWLVSAWLDIRALDPTQLRTLFYFQDGSFIQLSTEQILFASPSAETGQGVQYIDIRNVGLGSNEMFHIAFRITQEHLDSTSTNSSSSLMNKTIRTYINGTRLANKKVRMRMRSYKSSVFSFRQGSEGSSHFYVGDPGSSVQLGDAERVAVPFQGWIDEVRVERLTTENRSPTSYSEELICNLALGTIVNIKQSDIHSNHEELKYLETMARQFGYFKTTNPSSISGENTATREPAVVAQPSQKAYICEQLNLDPRESVQQFPRDNDPRACIKHVHREAYTNLFADRCMRTQLLDLEDKALHPYEMRPDFSSVGFCVDCHKNKSTFAPLNMNALVPSSTNQSRINDKRRQPLDPPGFIHGCIEEEMSVSPERCTSRGGFPVDTHIFEHGFL